MVGNSANVPWIVVVTSDPLVPVTGGGARRMLRMIAHLRSQGYRVGLIAIEHPRSARRELKAQVDRLWIVKSQPDLPVRERLRLAIRGAFRRLLPQPLYLLGKRVLYQFIEPPRPAPPAPRPTSFILRKINPRMRAITARVVKEFWPRAVIAQYVWSAHALDVVPDQILTVIDTIDVQHRRREHALAAGSDLPHHRCSREEETRELQRADVLIAIQRHETHDLAGMCPQARVICVGHAVDRLERLPSPEDGARRILFVGARYDPNIQGMRLFMDEAWPRIRAAVPDAELVICGRVCDDLHQLPPGVRLEGLVPDLTARYAQAAVVINPVPYGTGLKIKTVEALSHGKCFVGTQAAVIGLEDLEPRPYIVTADMEEMGDVVARLLLNPAERRAMEERAWQAARDRLAPQQVYRPLMEILEQAKTIPRVRRRGEHGVPGDGNAGLPDQIRNGSFEQWAPGGPVAWTVTPEGHQALRGRTPDGAAAVELPPAPDRQATLFQLVRTNGVAAGAAFEIEMEALASEPGKFGLVVTLFPRSGGTPVIHASNHAGGGQWQRLALSIRLDNPSAVQQIKVVANLRAGATRPVWIRHCASRWEAAK